MHRVWAYYVSAIFVMRVMITLMATLLCEGNGVVVVVVVAIMLLGGQG